MPPCKEITGKVVVYEQSGEKKSAPCDSVDMAACAKPNNYSGMIAVCNKRYIPYYIVGDAAAARRTLSAVSEGVEAALKILESLIHKAHRLAGVLCIIRPCIFKCMKRLR